MAKIQAPHDAERFGFAPQASPRIAKIDQSFRMNFWSRVTIAAPLDADEAEAAAEPALTLPIIAPQPAALPD